MNSRISSETHPLTQRDAWNVIAWASYERILSSEAFKMDPRQRSLALMTFSDLAAPSGWPPLSTRWALGSVTFAVLVGGLAASAINLKQVIQRIDLSSYARLWFTAPLTLFAGSVAVMWLGALAWGWCV